MLEHNMIIQADVLSEGDGRKANGRPAKSTEAERREKRRIKAQKYRAKHPERVRATNRKAMKKIYAATAIAEGRMPGLIGRPPKIVAPEESRAKQNNRVKRYYAEHLESCRAYGATMARNRRSLKKGNGGKHTAADIKQLWFLQKGKCAWCLQALGEAKPHVDHYVPLAKGGANDKRNLRLLHELCNLKKGAQDPLEYGLKYGTLAW